MPIRLIRLINIEKVLKTCIYKDVKYHFLGSNQCFIGFNSKRRNFPTGKRRKRAIAAISVVTEFCVSQQTSKQMAKKLSHDNISFVITQRSEY